MYAHPSPSPVDLLAVRVGNEKIEAEYLLLVYIHTYVHRPVREPSGATCTVCNSQPHPHELAIRPIARRGLVLGSLSREPIVSRPKFSNY